MGRGVSCGGGQSSLGYLFGGGETTANKAPPPPAPANNPPPQNEISVAAAPASKESKPIDNQIPAGIHGSPTNNYHRVDGQNCGNFITDRPSTKVHSAPGGGSSLGYLFGGAGAGN